MNKMAARELCTGCGACAAICEAISMEPDREGFLYPVIDRARCVGCGRCGTVCTQRNAQPPPFPRSYWGAQAREETVRSLGSSGGMFPLLAAQVLREGGTVFGAALQRDGTVRHIGIDKPEDIPRISRTKYVQSDLSQVWDRLDPLLREGRRVLFCGTPCQTAALRAVRNGDRRGLILVDLICYGVPSPGIWADYVRLLEKKYRGDLRTFSFRDKRGRDNGHTAFFEAGGQRKACPLEQDRFFRSYARNINIRPSCFRCPYCTTRRSSDITLGDFWGLGQVRPELDDGMGTSAVICHTAQGQRLWEAVREQTRWFSCREEDIANDRQPRLREPTQPSPRRDWYMWWYRRLPFWLWLRLL